MHICVSKLTIIVADNGLSPDRRQAIIWTNAEILSIWTNLNKLQWNLKWNSYIFIQENALGNVVCEMAAILSWPQCVNTTTSLVAKVEWNNMISINWFMTYDIIRIDYQNLKKIKQYFDYKIIILLVIYIDLQLFCFDQMWTKGCPCIYRNA